MADVLLERVRAFLQTQDLLRAEALLLVAVSGGPDSLCLLHLLWRLRAIGGPELHVAHLDHGARGEQSAAEASAVAALAARWGLPATLERRDVPALARERGEGLMAAARYARYRFLAETAAGLDADAVAVAHQADDQAETVLLRLIRGAGSTGLRGMREVVAWEEWSGDIEKRPAEDVSLNPSVFLAPRPLLIRPLLATPRAAIEAYCRAQALSPADDPSNRNERFARTRVRRALSLLKAENPRIVQTLGRTARILADEQAFLLAQLDAAWPTLAEQNADGILLRQEAFAALHPALQRHAIRRAVSLLGRPELSMEQVEAARNLATHGGPRIHFSRWLYAEAVDSGLSVAPVSAAPLPPGPQLPTELVPLPVPGSVSLGEGWRLVASDRLPHPSMASGPMPPSWVRIDPATLDGPLVLRRRRPGDRFRPLGGMGSRNLQDFFVDRKVPRALRAAWPILATPTAIVWVVGQRADSRFVALEPAANTLWIALVNEAEA